jgi:Domain of unknown function (DUF1707)
MPRLGGLTVGYDGAIRASDSDREGVVEILRQAYAEGRLDLAEFDERTTAAYAARTWAQLHELTRDLPVGAEPGAGLRPAGTLAGLAGPDAAGRAAVPGSAEVRQPYRGPGFVPFLPLVLFWVLLAGAARGGSGIVVPAVIMFFIWLRLAWRHHHGRDHRPGGSPPRPGGGQA